jgi:integrase/recombinase XerD
MGERYTKHRPLFLSQSPVPGKGERLGYQGIYYTIRELGQIAGIANLTPHRLRHTYATKLLLKGIDSLHARTLTRHKSEANFKRYAKRALAAAAERAFYEAIGEEPPTP